MHKTFLATEYEDNGFIHFPVMAYDPNEPITEQEPTRQGTVSVRVGVPIGEIIDALTEAFGA